MSAVVSTARAISRTWTFFEGEWREGNIAIMGPRTHAAALTLSPPTVPGQRLIEPYRIYKLGLNPLRASAHNLWFIDDPRPARYR